MPPGGAAEKARAAMLCSARAMEVPMTLSRRHLLHLAALAPTAALAQGAPPGMPLDLAHLTHGFAPVPDELDIPRLSVEGEIPATSPAPGSATAPTPPSRPRPMSIPGTATA
jgi:hypothetical protein